MTRAVVFLPSARAELLGAIEAANERTGRGSAFRDEAERVKDRLGEAPEAHALDPEAPEGREVRRARIGRYPWRYVYVVEPARVLVIAVAHARREPGYWRERLG